MKTCTQCHEEKPISSFYKQPDRSSGASLCKDCFNKYCTARWVERKKKAVDYLGGKCEHCGFDSHYSALHFHHKNPEEKVAVWSKMRLWSWDKTKAELDKCQLLCANCHAITHWSS